MPRSPVGIHRPEVAAGRGGASAQRIFPTGLPCRSRRTLGTTPTAPGSFAVELAMSPVCSVRGWSPDPGDTGVAQYRGGYHRCRPERGGARARWDRAGPPLRSDAAARPSSSRIHRRRGFPGGAAGRGRPAARGTADGLPHGGDPGGRGRVAAIVAAGLGSAVVGGGCPEGLPSGVHLAELTIDHSLQRPGSANVVDRESPPLPPPRGPVGPNR